MLEPRREYKVVIPIPNWGYRQTDKADEMIEQIKRHVDTEEDPVVEENLCCEHCHLEWDDCFDDEGDVQCCAQLMKEQREETRERERKQLESAPVRRGRVQTGETNG